MTLYPNKKFRLPSSGDCSCLSPDAKTLYVGLKDGRLIAVDLASEEIISSSPSTYSKFYSCVSSSDGSTLATTSVGEGEDTIILWNGSLKQINKLRGHTDRVFGCAFSPDRSLIVSVSADCNVRVWKCPFNGESLIELDKHVDKVFCCKFAPNGEFFATGSLDQSIRVWSAVTFECVAVLEGHTGSISTLDYSPDSRFIVSGSDDHLLKVWSTKTFKCVSTLAEHEDQLVACYWIPTGKYIFSCSESESVVKIWDTNTWRCVNTIKVNNEHHDCLSKNGALFVSGSEQKIYVWNVESKMQHTLSNLNLSELNFGDKVLGAGAFGKVYRGEYCRLPVAIKTLHSSLISSNQEQFQKEIETLMTLRHPNITTCWGYSLDSYEPLIVMEFMPFNLKDWIKKQVYIDPQTIFKILRDIACGMEFLHTHKPHRIIHRDLKSSNILLDHNLTAKLCDFGEAKMILDTNITNTNREIVGTVAWAAPEYLNPAKYKDRNEKGDVYSFGVVVWELVTRQLPWCQSTPLDIVILVTSGEQLEIPTDCDKVLRDIMLNCWKENPSERPSFSELLRQLPKNC